MLKHNVLGAVTIAALVSLATSTGTAHATTYNFAFAGVCGGGTEACAATAAITPGSGSLTVVLTDPQADPRSAGDLISGIQIGLGGTPTLSSQNGTLITVTSTSGPYVTAGGPPTHWGVGASGGNIVLETAGAFAVGGQPINMIIGPPAAGGNYTHANASITNGNFSPYINQVGTFVILDSSITNGTDLTNTVVAFLFGTTPDFTRTATFTGSTPPGGSGLGTTPLPAALPLFAGGLGALGLLGWRRKRRAQAA